MDKMEKDTEELQLEATVPKGLMADSLCLSFSEEEKSDVLPSSQQMAIKNTGVSGEIIYDNSAVSNQNASPKNEQSDSKIFKPFKAIKSICERIVGNLIASGIVSQISNFL